MTQALLVLAVVFALAFIGRVGGARRSWIAERWPVLFFAGAALFAVARGYVWPGLGLGLVAVVLWFLPLTALSQPSPQNVQRENAEDAEARRLLGVGAEATAAEIRAAYRRKMAESHPDRGGTHADAASLNVARDRLLKRRR